MEVYGSQSNGTTVNPEPVINVRLSKIPGVYFNKGTSHSINDVTVEGVGGQLVVLTSAKLKVVDRSQR